ncbi:uncharacterized protein LOC124148574 [Haliotis rufescens]|uniref:uncharacterized protein LOC124148574 n=1 Tax=Haliotis rufescens TaxID=6454 RepID=UPI00201EA907|nr:uncharacterized protein LOC124148574 [Haliotis rufescens]
MDSFMFIKILLMCLNIGILSSAQSRFPTLGTSTVKTTAQTTLDPLLMSGMGGFLQMIQEFGSLRAQVEQQEETNKLLQGTVTRLEALLEQVNNTAVQETDYLKQGSMVQQEISTLLQTTTFIEAEMTNAVTTATMLEMEMMKVEKSLDDVTDCHDIFKARLDNMTSSLVDATDETNLLSFNSEMLNQTMEELNKDIMELTSKSDDLKVSTSKLDSIACQSGRLFFRGSSRYLYSRLGYAQWPESQSVHFSKQFIRSPTISYGVVGMEADKDYDVKFNLTINDVRSSGFELQCNANGKGELVKLDVQWIACLV